MDNPIRFIDDSHVSHRVVYDPDRRLWQVWGIPDARTEIRAEGKSLMGALTKFAKVLKVAVREFPEIVQGTKRVPEIE